jgi:hypothetical protein
MILKADAVCGCATNHDRIFVEGHCFGRNNSGGSFMKQILVFLILIVCGIVGRVERSWATQDIIINSGAEFPVCQGLYKILKLPRNSGYIISANGTMTGNQINSEVLHERSDQLYDGRQLVIPAGSAYADFSEPKWVDVPDSVAHEMFPKLILRSRETLGEDYKFQKATLDMEGDEKKETFYREFGKGSNHVTIEGEDLHEEPLNGKKGPYSYEGIILNSLRSGDPAQVFLYKGTTYFLHRRLFVITVDSFAVNRKSLTTSGSDCAFSFVDLY